jgi:hypothetical protein
MSARRILGLGALGLFWLSGIAFGEETVTFAHYNVENYLEMNRREGGEATLGPKPEREKKTLIRIIKEIHPDILGVAEMGPPDQFEEFKKRLKEAGLEFPFTEYVSGADRDRHLALLSRFEIVERHSERDLFFDLNGQREPVERGFLDVTIEVSPTLRLRVVGAHLKSKLAVASGEALLRLNEARLLRQHIDAAYPFRGQKTAPLHSGIQSAKGNKQTNHERIGKGGGVAIDCVIGEQRDFASRYRKETETGGDWADRRRSARDV